MEERVKSRSQGKRPGVEGKMHENLSLMKEMRENKKDEEETHAAKKEKIDKMVQETTGLKEMLLEAKVEKVEEDLKWKQEQINAISVCEDVPHSRGCKRRNDDLRTENE